MANAVISIISTDAIEKVGSNLRVTGVLNSTGKCLFVSPKTYTPASGQITSAGQLSGLKTIVSGSYFEVTAADYLDSDWTTAGWKMTDISPQLLSFTNSNIVPYEANASTDDIVILVGRKTIDGVGYTIVLSYPGNATNINKGALMYMFGRDLALPQEGSPYQMLYQFPTLAAGAYHAVALDSNNRPWAWGSGGTNIGTGLINNLSPSRVVGNHKFVSISANGDGNTYVASYGLKENGEVWAWGYNVWGMLGDGTTTTRSSPVLVVGSHSFTQVVADIDRAFALKADGSLWSWGSNANGGLGDGTATYRSSPVLVIGNHSFTQVAPTMALKANGEVWAWGNGSNGRLGDNTATSKSSPVLVVGSHSFTQVTAGGGSQTRLALKANGEAWAWGIGNFGMLGNNSINSCSSPVLVVGNHSFTSIRSGYNFAAALKSNGQVWTWGNGIANVNAVSGSSPELVVGSISFSNVTTGMSNIFCVGGGSYYSWGYNISLRGLSVPSSNPYVVSGTPANAEKALKLPNSVTILDSNGSAWSKGENANGNLGDGTSDFRGSYVAVVGSHSFTDISKSVRIGLFNSAIYDYYHSAALKSNGQVWTWGMNDSGELGDNSKSYRSSPVLVVGNHSFTKVLAGGFMMGLKANGQVWTWGSGSNGSLGDNTATSKSSPVLVVGSHSFIDIASCAYSGNGYGLKSNGQVWSWGIGSVGNSTTKYGGPLGDNTLTNKSSPVLVAGSHSFTQIAASNSTYGFQSTGGTYYALVMGLKADGSVWTWGTDIQGQLGKNAIGGTSSPVLVVGGHSFTKIASYNGTNGFGLKADNTVWGWGSNSNGELGTGDLSNRSSPVLMTGVTGFADIFGSGAGKRVNI